MPISVFPERMDKLDPEDVNASLRTLETYVHYICERTEYAITNTFRTTNGLGSSAEAISLVLQEAVDNLSSLTGEVGALASAVNGKVDKVEGMGLSSNDYTDEEKEDVDTIDGLADRVTNLEEQGGEANVIEIVKRNGTALPVSGKAVDVTVPTRVSELTNDSGYQNAQQVQAAVSAGLDFLLISETYGPSAMASFSGEAEGLPLKKCQVDIAPVRAGSGDPSPSNVRAITGWTGAQIYVSPTTTAGDGKTYTVDWTTEAGTVYGGTLDVLTGKLTIDKKVVVIKGDASETWSSVNQSYSIALIKTSGIAEGALISSHYTSVTAPVRWGSLANNQAQFSSDNYIGYKDIANNGTSVATAKAYAQQQYANGTPITFVGRLKNPVIYQLTPQMVTTLAGQNNVWADCGNVTVEYGAFLAALQAEIERLQEGGN